jgi:iron complex transport system substrate-binding protein
MKTRRAHGAVALAFTLLSACSKNQPPAPPAPQGRLAVENATRFSIEYMADGVKLVRDGDGNELLLVPRGADVPPAAKDKKVVRTPLRRAFFMSVTHVSMLLALEDDEALDSIAGTITDADDWTLAPIVERFARGQIQYVPWTVQSGVNVETLAALAPDMVFSSAGYESPATLFPKLDELGIPYMEVSEYLEASNVAALEWIKFFAAFYNLDEEAAAVYEAKRERLEELARLVAEKPRSARPLVAVAHVFKGKVFVEGGGSTTAQELEKAGGRYCLEEMRGNVNVQIGMEEFFSRAKDADILIYAAMESDVPDKKALLEELPLAASFKAFRDNRIYVLSKGYYMNGAALDVKFEDVVSIFHPDLLPGRALTFYAALPDRAHGGAHGGVE